MISLPVIEELKIRNYDLYPGKDGNGLDINFEEGVTVLAGINGVGKTTLLNLLLRLLLGPSNPKKVTKDIGRVSERKLVLPSRKEFKFFSDRVPSLPDYAAATIKFKIGDKTISVTRYLSTLYIKEIKVNNRTFRAEGEIEFIEKLAEYSGLKSAYDFHMVVRYLQFFSEERLPILWSASTQFEFFNILITKNEISKKLHETFALIQRKDSDYRNRKNILSQKEKELPQPTGSASIELSTLKRMVTEAEINFEDAEREFIKAQNDFNEYQKLCIDLENERSECELRLHESTYQLTYEDANYIQQALPSMDDKLQFLMQGLGSHVGCFVCGTKGNKEHRKIGKKLRNGNCFVCDSGLAKKDKADIIPINSKNIRLLESEVSKLTRELNALEKKYNEYEKSYSTSAEALRKSATKKRDTLYSLEDLRSQLPDDEDNSGISVHDEIEREKAVLKGLDEERKELTEIYRGLVSEAQKDLDAFRDIFEEKISNYASAFLQEKVEVAFKRQSPMVLATGVAKVNVPTFNIKMASSTFKTPKERSAPDNVSESQKEFLDLSFRMAILDLITGENSSMMIIETPEASLDSWFMQRAAELMRQFALAHGKNERKLIATSNVNGTIMIPALLGLIDESGAISKTLDKNDPHLVNLMELTAKARILERGEAKDMLLKELRGYLSA